MSPEAQDRLTLAQRLRGLRTSPQFGRLKQQQLADALNVSEALISSWEKGAAIPPEHRLQAYARFFSTPRSVSEGQPRLLAEGDLLDDESQRMQALEEELLRLRDAALHVQPSYRDTGELGGRFWYFPDGARVTIVCTKLSNRQLGLLPNGQLPEGASPITAYSRPSHPNYIASLQNGDMDALTELVGHIRAENPNVEVRWTTLDKVETDALSGHLVLLGGWNLNVDGTEHGTQWWFSRRLELPVRVHLPEGGDEEFDMEFVVHTDDEGKPQHRGRKAEAYPPRFLRIDSNPDRPRVIIDEAPQLEYDTALLVRKPNPINLSARIIICTGIFSRGTYGAVRLTTDATLRRRNETFLSENFDIDNFWLLLHVPVLDGKTATPDLGREFLRLRHS